VHKLFGGTLEGFRFLEFLFGKEEPEHDIAHRNAALWFINPNQA